MNEKDAVIVAGREKENESERECVDNQFEIYENRNSGDERNSGIGILCIAQIVWWLILAYMP